MGVEGSRPAWGECSASVPLLPSHHGVRIVATVSVSAAVREALRKDLTLPADDVIKLVQRRGVTAPEKSIRESVHNIRSELKRKAAKAVPAAARTTAPAAAARPAATGAPAASPAAPSADLTSLLANVALVNRVMTLAGGPDNARQVAEAVRACGGVDAFLQHLDTVAGITAAK